MSSQKLEDRRQSLSAMQDSSLCDAGSHEVGYEKSHSPALGRNKKAGPLCGVIEGKRIFYENMDTAQSIRTPMENDVT